MPLYHPICSVEVYPFEGGSYAIQGGQIIACQTHKNIRDAAGTFSIHLAPGGPNGPNSSLSWLDIITPMSFVLIGMSRAGQTAIVMIGVVAAVTEQETWTPDQSVTRTIVVAGQDFGYFFTSFNWNALTFLGSPASIAGQALGNTTGAAYAQVYGQGIVTGSPAFVAKTWYNNIMAGNDGVLSQTYVNWSGNQVSFNKAVATFWEEYPGFTIPYGDFFMTSEGTWSDKFKAILEWPFYEFFVITAPPNIYGASGGTAFTMKSFPGVTATPTAVGRINPIPYAKISASGSGGTATANSVDMSRWNKLQNYSLTTNFLNSTARFSEEEVANFYMINPVWLNALVGAQNNNPIPFMYQYNGAVDPASIHRYGFKPIVHETHWFTDLKGQSAQQASSQGGGQTTIDNLVTDLLSRLFSYYEPTTMMLRGGVEFPLFPTILPGNKIQYSPFKGEPPWTCYVEIVDHLFVFGGASKTRLGFTRGLPTSVYGDQGLLGNLCIGNAYRKDGQYNSGLSGNAGQNKPLEVINLTNTSSQQVLGDIAKVYITPQGNAQPQ